MADKFFCNNHAEKNISLQRRQSSVVLPDFASGMASTGRMYNEEVLVK